MDRSATKGLDLNGSDAADIPKNSSFGCVRPNYRSSSGWVQPSYCTSFSRICVEGYDTSLYEYDLKLALRKHFSSCGEITHIYVPRDFERNILKSFAFIHIAGEGAEEKALALSGSDAGGWNVFVKSSPYDGQYVDPGWATVESPHFSLPRRMMIVTGYDTSLPEIDIQIGLSNHFSSCGEITNVMIPKDANGGLNSKAHISILGAGAVEKALELGGCDVGGWNIAVVTVIPPLGTTIRYCSSSSLSLPNKS
ncbi:RNA-binding domain superfamily [Arabidopsis thaliana x Arabidopsis arenosa]|uniref:RNA-binding domain superfamily n=1 Tax=Arabidopsis thaliana x Arabidopsis arenosa TaxID=1240361 RepID=A0A8T2C175_9BRAS|nr:RNA-binding domain superfamily [Arabidopsis thaliana x Arabidopsis arenosa]